MICLDRGPTICYDSGAMYYGYPQRLDCFFSMYFIVGYLRYLIKVADDLDSQYREEIVLCIHLV